MEWTAGSFGYSKELMNKSRYGVLCEEVELNRGTHSIADLTFVSGYFILEGTVTVDGAEYGRKTLIWFKDTKAGRMELKENVHALFIETGIALKKEQDEIAAFEDEKLSWNRPLTEGACCSKHMILAEEYGVKLQTGIYTKNCDIPKHTHSISHGFYVLEGVLELGDGTGKTWLLGPGEFEVMDAGKEMTHTAAPGCEYASYFFICNGIFDFLVDGKNIKE